MGEKRVVRVKVNGKAYEAEAEVRMHLADFIRQELGLTGTHIGCEHGVCGACTILLDGKIRRASVTVSGVGPSPVRLTAAEKALVGQAPNADLFRSVAEEGRKIEALSDIHAPSEYRQHLAAVLSRRALEKAQTRLGGGR